MASLRVEETRLALLGNAAVALVVAAAIFFLSYANGGFDATTRAYAAIPVWWLLAVGAATGLGGARSRPSRLAIAASSLLALFAVWILVSVQWAPDAGAAFAQFDQVSLYVAVFVLAIVLARLVSPSALVGGIAVALSALAVVAFVSRVFPSTFNGTAGAAFLVAIFTRLSFPFGYWNGLGIDIALAYPLLLATMASRRHPLLRAVAALPLPVIAADMYLTSSRGAFTATAVAVVVYLALTANRWLALAATLVAGASGVAAVGYVLPRKAFISGPTTALAVRQGHHVALAVGLIALATAVVWLGVSLLASRLPAAPPAVGWATVALIAILAGGTIVALHPVRRFESFKRLPTYGGSGPTVESHLLSTSSNGRWQLWSETMAQSRAYPLKGEGAGSWNFWWQQHRSIPLQTTTAHSLYLETLGELGIVGLLLLGAAIVVAVAGAVRASLVLRSPEVAAAAAAGIAFFAAAAYDWIWPLSGITVVGVGCLGIALGSLPSSRVGTWGRFGLVRPLLALVAVAAVVPQIVLLAASIHLRNSQNAIDAGNGARARSEALAAEAVEPWSSAPYLQLGLIAEQQGRYDEARAWIGDAIARSDRDGKLWYYAARVDTERAHATAAVTDFRRARRLFPGSSLAGSSGG